MIIEIFRGVYRYVFGDCGGSMCTSLSSGHQVDSVPLAIHLYGWSFPKSKNETKNHPESPIIILEACRQHSEAPVSIQKHPEVSFSTCPSRGNRVDGLPGIPSAEAVRAAQGPKGFAPDGKIKSKL